MHHREDVPQDLYDETFPLFNSLVSPWHQFLDPVRYGRHVDSVAALRPEVVATAHGPVLTGAAIPDAFDRVRALAGQPRIMGPRSGRPRRDGGGGDLRRRVSRTVHQRIYCGPFRRALRPHQRARSVLSTPATARAVSTADAR